MRILVCGGRDFDDWESMSRTLESIYLNENQDIKNGEVQFTIIEGGAKGADFLARVWAKWRMLPFEEYPADWNKHGYQAGAIRNKQMLEEGKPDLVIAFKGGKGTADMVKRARYAGVEVREIP